MTVVSPPELDIAPSAPEMVSSSPVIKAQPAEVFNITNQDELKTVLKQCSLKSCLNNLYKIYPYKEDPTSSRPLRQLVRTLVNYEISTLLHSRYDLPGDFTINMDLLKEKVSAYLANQGISVKLEDFLYRNLKGVVVPLNNIDVSEMESLASVFNRLRASADISDWDVSKVKNMRSLFTRSYFNGDISKWDVSKVEDARYLFAGSKFTGDITEWQLSSLKESRGMFRETDKSLLLPKLLRAQIEYKPTESTETIHKKILFARNLELYVDK